MSAVDVVVAAAVSFMVLVLGKVCLDLMSKELQGQVELLPHWILRLAARRLPRALRARYFEDWEAELDYIVKWHDARPITRLLLGFRFATSLLRGARRLRADHMSQPQYSIGLAVHLPRVYSVAALARKSRWGWLVGWALWIFLGGRCAQVTRSGIPCMHRVSFPHTLCHVHRKGVRVFIAYSEQRVDR